MDFLKRIPGAHSLAQLPFLSSLYHFLLAFFAAFCYGFPSRKLTVIGVTGTKGKTTTCNLISQILSEAGYVTGLATTVNFKVDGKEWVNATKQTMLGRFALQKLFRDMVRAKCTHAIIETSSEGILQHRHRFINYRAAVFTNLSSEHIERHGSFERYRDTKLKLFDKIAARKDGIGVFNLDDEHVGHFLSIPVPRRYGYTLRDASPQEALTETFHVKDMQFGREQTSFSVNGEAITTPLLGEFNVANAASALALTRALGVSWEVIRQALAKAPRIPGRFEVVNYGQPFTVIVDYAHEPASLEAAYRAARIFNPKRVIALLGAQGGGRDQSKRVIMGAVVATYAEFIILTNEDPYDEDPQEIIDDINKGITSVGFDPTRLFLILDRREAIRKAFSLAEPDDLVILTGKGGEVWMCVAHGKKIPWNELEVVEELLRERNQNTK